MRLGLILAALALLAATAPAARAMPLVGVGEQHHEVFSDQRFAELGINHMRYVVGWDAMKSSWQRGEMDAWLGEARRTGAEVVVSFGVSRTLERKIAPAPRAFRRQFLRFHKRYPWVKTFIPWNESNHCSQPTCRRPDLAAAYFDVLRSACTTCTVVAADVLDYGDMVGWVRAFKQHARHRTRIWGLHNYVDANRFRTSGTEALLRAVKGQIWFTETGGLVRRRNPSAIPLNESAKHAAKAVRWVFKLATLSPRIKRIYFYHWMPAADRKARWDSALVNRRGRPRPALKVIRRWVAARAAEQAAREQERRHAAAAEQSATPSG